LLIESVLDPLEPAGSERRPIEVFECDRSGDAKRREARDKQQGAQSGRFRTLPLAADAAKTQFMVKANGAQSVSTIPETAPSRPWVG
jgi:hypothetical protein